VRYRATDLRDILRDSGANPEVEDAAFHYVFRDHPTGLDGDSRDQTSQRVNRLRNGRCPGRGMANRHAELSGTRVRRERCSEESVPHYRASRSNGFEQLLEEGATHHRHFRFRVPLECGK
jgi:hypothetical protein